jgi:hypothetical protein
MKRFSAFSAIAAFLFAAAVFLGLRGQHEITKLRSEQESLVAKVSVVQTRSDAPPTRPWAERKTPRPRKEIADPIPAIRADLIALVRRIDGPHPVYGLTGDNLNLQKDIIAIQQSLRTLSSTQIQSLLEEFRNPTGLSDDERKQALSILIATTAGRYPQSVLGMLMSDENKELPYRREGMKAAIKSLSATEPSAAMAWLQSLPPGSPWIKELLPEAIEFTAYSDLQVAADLIREFGVDRYMKFASDLPEALDASQCGEWIDILRASPDDFDIDIRTKAIGKMGAPIARQGFEKGTRWIAAHLKEPEEIAALLNAITIERSNPETGRWIEWSGKHLPESMRDQQVESMISKWTTRDHLAAGEWLAALPNSPTKVAAAAGFAKTVAPFEPDAAMEWAQTLPPGPARDATKLPECCPCTVLPQSEW